jgi:mannose-6-phosphate isomerase
VLCTKGTLELHGRSGSFTVHRGESVLVTPDEGPLDVASGTGTLFVATPNR